MKTARPQFELTRVYSDGSQDEPEIVPVAQMPWDTKMNRRGVLGVGLTVTGVLALLSGCDKQNIFSSQTVKETELEDLPEIQRKSPTTVLKAHKQNVSQLIFSADSTTLISASTDFTVKQWAIPDCNLLGTVTDKTLRAGLVKATPDGKTLIADLGKELAFWSLPQGNLLKKITVGETAVGGVFGGTFALSPDGKICAVTRSNTIKLYSVPEGELLKTLTDDSMKNISLVDFAPNGKILITGAMDEEFKLWSLPDGNLLGKLEKSRNLISSEPVQLLINPESTVLALNYQGQLRFWSLPDGKKIEKVVSDSFIQNPTLASDGKMLITTGRHYPTPGPKSPSPSVQTPLPNYYPSPNYPMPVSTPYNTTAVKLWSFPEMKLQTIGKIKTQSAMNGNWAKIVTTADGKMLAVVFQGKNDVWLMSLPELKLEHILKGNVSAFSSPIFTISPDGKYLAMGDADGTVMIWDLQQREFLAFLFDKQVNRSSVKGVAYNVKDKVTGRTITYTLPCGSPIPPGAICTCNCVPGVMSDPVIPRPKPKPRPRVNRGGGFSYCSCNKICTCIPVPSDREVKESFETTNSAEILQKLSELSISKWNYKWDDASIRHIGPMAQDFAEAFEVGDSDKHIHPVDANGIAFAAIQGLYRLLKEKEAETRNLQTQLQKQVEESRQLKARIERLEQLENG